MTHRHYAYCPQTGEVLSSSTSNALKRHLRTHLAFDRKWVQAHPEENLGRRSWVFSHEGLDKLSAKQLGYC